MTNYLPTALSQKWFDKFKNVKTYFVPVCSFSPTDMDTCNNNSMVLDVQGFKTGKNKFIPKELAAYDGNRICHYIFRPPFALNCLDPETLKHTSWLMQNHHCIPWDTGYTPLYKFASIVKDLTEKVDIIYVKGNEKANFLRKYSKKPIVELEDHPPLKTNIPRCFYHTNKESSMCALFNVFFLYDHFIMQ